MNRATSPATPAATSAPTLPAHDAAADAFTAGGTSIVMPEIWNAGAPLAVSDALIGRLTGFREFVHRQFGPCKLAMFDDVVIREAGALTYYAGMGVILTRFLAPRIEAKYVDRVLSLVYIGEAKSSNGKPMRCYAIAEQTRERLEQIIGEAQGAGFDEPA